MITDDQAKVYQTISDIICKFLLVISGIVAFFIVLFKMLSVDTWQMTTVYVAFEGMLGGTIFVIIRHFFPAR